MAIYLLPEVDFNCYRNRYNDLANHSDEQLSFHWQHHGLNEARNASTITTRAQFLSSLAPCQSLLEIGCFDRPSLDFLADGSKTIHYADWLSRDELVKRAKQLPGRNHLNVPEIRYVLSAGYEQITRKYDAIVSHHCVEHQPDLIGHFKNVLNLLEPHGAYFFSLPDKRRCFDHFIPESSILDVIVAHLEGRSRPSLMSVLEHRCFTSHNWKHDLNPYLSMDPAKRLEIDKAFAEYRLREYVDVHCWQFTPASTKLLLSQLRSYSYIPELSDTRVYCSDGEFFVALAFAKDR